jgi:hypothetical protein
MAMCSRIAAGLSKWRMLINSERLHRIRMRSGRFAATAEGRRDAVAIAFRALLFLNSVEGQNGAVGPPLAVLTIPSC